MSQSETVSSRKLWIYGRFFCQLQLGFGRREFARNNRITEARGLMRAIAERLVGRVPAAAKANGGTPSQTKGAPFGIDDLEVTLHTNRAVAIDGNLGRCHFRPPEKSESAFGDDTFVERAL